MHKVALLVVVLLSSSVVAADNWPEFRGPGGDGQAASSDLPLTWGETQNVKWKTPIHGKGWSSPVVWGDQLWMTTASEDGKKLSAICLNRQTGKIVHDLLVIDNEYPNYCEPSNSYASPTPAIEEGRVYVHYGSYGTACLNSKTGETLWVRRDLQCDHWRGPGSSPILHENLLIVALDGFDYQYVVALDKKTGKNVWKKDRNIDYGTANGDRKKAYSTATVIEVNGKKQLISPSAFETIAYDPATGKDLWHVKHGGMNAAARPLFGHGLVYLSAGAGPLSLIAVRPDGNGDVTETHIQWSLGKATPRRPSQLLVGPWMFMMNDQGIATCLDAKTGKKIWQKRLGGNYRASPIHANGRIYCFSLDGVSPVFEAGPEYKLLAENQLENGFQASPAVVGDSLYLRSTKHLYCISK